MRKPKNNLEKLHHVEKIVAAIKELHDVVLLAWSAQRIEPLPDQMQITAGVEGQAQREPEAGNALVVHVKFYVSGHDGNPEKPFVNVKAHYALRYEFSTSNSDFSDEELQAFAESNGVFNAWPYWRELVHTSTVRMGLPALVMPLYKVGATLMASVMERADAPLAKHLPTP